jgi:predicted ribosome quality control (RQC) complex YloA/Tae2 family protein
VDNFYLSALVRELEPEVLGRTVLRVSLAHSILLIDLRLPTGRQLLASMDRANPALYLSTKVSAQPARGHQSSTFFLSLVRKHLVGSRVTRIRKEPSDRVVQIDFEKLDAGDDKVRASLFLTLTGRSANAYLTDDSGQVIASLFERELADQAIELPLSLRLESSAPLDLERLKTDLNDSTSETQILEHFFGADSIFSPQLKKEFLVRISGGAPAAAFKSLLDDLSAPSPEPIVYSRLPLEKVDRAIINPRTDLLLSNIKLTQARGMIINRFSGLSEAADQFYSARGRAMLLRAEHTALKQTLAREVEKRESVIRAIESDRSRFDQPDKLKRMGDLILANLANARIEGTRATLVDYYDPGLAEVQIEIPDGFSLKEAASDYFARYQKAQRALTAIAAREREVLQTLGPLKHLLSRIEAEPGADSLEEAGIQAEKLLGKKRSGPRTTDKRGRRTGSYAFGRRFRSSDGYEIVVGRNDRDNDALTFRVAKPNDVWLHAADYPGSHAIIRNPSRDAPPHRTITEAAEVAAFYSQAKGEGKAAVHYTLKKFVSKPPRSKPGLVRLSSFKTIIVEPRCDLEKLD